LKADKWILTITLALLAFGLLMVASASMVVSDKIYHSPLHFFMRQSIYLALALLLAAVVWRVPIDTWQRFSGYLFLFGLLLLVLVLLPGIGRTVNGSRRWLNLGLLTLQVSELVKFFMVLYMARYIQRFHVDLRTHWLAFVKPLILLALVAFLLLLEPDFGAAVVITATTLLMLYLSGARLLPFIVLLLVVMACLALLAVTSPYRLARLTSFLNPWHTPFGSGYQLTQSLMAFGRGGVFGVGLGNSVQKLFYLPEAHTDFLFAVIAEELGLIGVIALIGLFLVLVLRTLWVGLRAQKQGRLFAAFLCYGIGFWLGLQAVVNMGVNMGILPTKGITLPFISYGGSSMLVNCMVIAVVLRVSHEISQGQVEATRVAMRYRKVT
jgi:cell division protein FtsW